MDDVPMRRRKRTRRSSGPKTPSPKPRAEKRKVRIDNTVSVGQLAHEMGLKSKEVIKALMGLGTMATINEQIDFETASLVANEFEYEVVNVGFEEVNVLIADEEVAGVELLPRPPIVTIMGHVDHGKTSLLDKIRNSRVAASEAGGITQHIGAYQVQHQDGLITFIDTPGHEAFTAMRARGAGATDIVVLVVAADDGVMPQTIESINHAKAAGVAIIVAVNKCDKPGVNPENVRQGLMKYELVPEEYGGETLMNNVSAMTGEGIDGLLESIQLVAELSEFEAAVDRHAEGVVLEARLEQGRGPVATILVKQGTLKQGDPLVLGSTWGKVRAMMDFEGKRIKTAGPATPVEIIGLDGVPQAGDHFSVVKSDKDARALASHRAEEVRRNAMSGRGRVSLQDLFAQAQAGDVKQLSLIIKADVVGSMEAIRTAFENQQIDGAEVKVLHCGVGKVTESDVSLASVNGAIIIGFNVRPDVKARRAAATADVEVRTYKVIYEALDDVRNALLGLLEPVYEERHQGAAEVRQVFVIPKIGAICGCMVVEGKVARNQKARLTRDGVVIWEGKIASLKRFKEDAKEVQQGYECGIGLEGYNDIKEGDEIESFIIEAVRRTA
jgi:translation initiation factor IF-2